MQLMRCDTLQGLMWSGLLCVSALRHVCCGAQETDCLGGMTHTEWCNPCLTSTDRLHPTAFKPDMVSQESMALMREVGIGHVFCAQPR